MPDGRPCGSESTPPAPTPDALEKQALNKKKLLLLGVLLALVLAFLALDLGRFFSLDYIKSTRGEFAALYQARPGAGAGRVLRDLCRGDGAVAAGRGRHDAARRRDLRAGGRHRAGVLRLQHRRHAGHAGVALRAARQREGEARRATGRYRPRHRTRRRVLPVHAAPGAGVPVLRHQPADGPDDDEGRHLLLGQPARHARRHAGVRQRRHAAGADQLAAGHPFAGADRLVRSARRVSADREEDRRRSSRGARCTRSGPRTSRRPSTATWSSSAPVPPAW